MNKEEADLVIGFLMRAGLKIVRVDLQTNQITVELPPTKNS